MTKELRIEVKDLDVTKVLAELMFKAPMLDVSGAHYHAFEKQKDGKVICVICGVEKE